MSTYVEKNNDIALEDDVNTQKTDEIAGTISRGFRITLSNTTKHSACKKTSKVKHIIL